MISDDRKNEIRGAVEEIKKNIERRKTCEDVILLAATKTRTPDEINYLADCSVKYIGENKVQELIEKYDGIDKEKFVIHFIGTLQTNKVKYIIDKVSMIESVDREELAAEINKQAAKRGIVMDVLMEVNVGMEESKSGVSPQKALELADRISSFPNLRLCGVMTIPPVCVNEETQKGYFEKINGIFDAVKAAHPENRNIKYRSYGMSGDYGCAVECGSNIVRIGTGIFGARNYNKQL